MVYSFLLSVNSNSQLCEPRPAYSSGNQEIGSNLILVFKIEAEEEQEKKISCCNFSKLCQEILLCSWNASMGMEVGGYMWKEENTALCNVT